MGMVLVVISKDWHRINKKNLLFAFMSIIFITKLSCNNVAGLFFGNHKFIARIDAIFLKENLWASLFSFCYRLSYVQVLCLLLTLTGFFVSMAWLFCGKELFRRGYNGRRGTYPQKSGRWKPHSNTEIREKIMWYPKKQSTDDYASDDWILWYCTSFVFLSLLSMLHWALPVSTSLCGYVSHPPMCPRRDNSFEHCSSLYKLVKGYFLVL